MDRSSWNMARIAGERRQRSSVVSGTVFSDLNATNLQQLQEQHARHRYSRKVYDVAGHEVDFLSCGICGFHVCKPGCANDRNEPEIGTPRLVGESRAKQLLQKFNSELRVIASPDHVEGLYLPNGIRVSMETSVDPGVDGVATYFRVYNTTTNQTLRIVHKEASGLVKTNIPDIYVFNDGKLKKDTIVHVDGQRYVVKGFGFTRGRGRSAPQLSDVRLMQLLMSGQ